MPERRSRADIVRYYLNNKEKELLKEESAWSKIFEASGVVDPNAQNELEATEAKTVVQTLLSNLEDRERTVIELRFLQGLSLREAAPKVGVSSEMVRQIEFSALGKLRTLIGVNEQIGKLSS
jgi:RNA polymerase sigma factor (sigma-70 family)